MNFKEIDKKVVGWLCERDATILYNEALNAPIPKILELGSYCGKSACFIASALKERNGSLLCCDYFPKNSKFWGKDILIKDVYKTFWENITHFHLQEIVMTFQGEIKATLRNLNSYFGMIYIDGGHTAIDVIPNGLYAWEHVVPGGTIIFHDYDNKEWPDVRICVQVLAKKWGVDIEEYGQIAIVRKP